MPPTTSFVSRAEVDYQEYVSQFGDSRAISWFFSEESGPQGFLLFIPENNVIGPHFHRVNQFQILFPSEGALYRRTAIDNVLVHYADGYVTYGPITTSTAPLEYFTLRAIRDNFVAYMPAEREKLIRRGKRNLYGAVASTLTTETTVETIFEDPSDGLLASVERTGPGGTISTIDPSDGGGQYHCVLSGSATFDGNTYVPQSLLWMAPDDTPASIVAGSDGLVLLSMQFPVGSREIHTEPDPP